MHQQKSLLEIMKEHDGRPFMKVQNYVKVYEKLFDSFRNKPINILEIGIYKGGSLQVWKKYFGEQARIFGVDINPECKSFEEEQIEIFIGDQEDKQFLSNLIDKLPTIDIIIDDGGHTMKQQINTFEVLYPKLAVGGVYLCEDCITSYDKDYGGGLKNTSSFIEYMKDVIDGVNAFHKPELRVDQVGQEIFSLSFYNNVVALEKQLMNPPKVFVGGNNRKELLRK